MGGEGGEGGGWLSLMRDELLRNTSPAPPPSTPGCLSRRGLQTREGLRATLRSRQLAADAPSTPMQRSRQRSISTPALEEQSSHIRQPSHLRQPPHTAVNTGGVNSLSPLTRSPWRSHSSPRWPPRHRSTAMSTAMSGALIGLGDTSLIGLGDTSLIGLGDTSLIGLGDTSLIGLGDTSLIGLVDTSPLGDTSPSSAVGLRLRRELIATPASSSHGRALLDFADFS